MEVAIIKAELEDKEKTKNYQFIERWSKRFSKIRPLFTEKVILNGLEKIAEERGPFIFTLKHESWFDAINLFPEWQKVYQRPAVKAIGRDDYAHIPFLDKIINRYSNNFIIPVKRSSKIINTTDEELKVFSKLNTERLNKAKDSLMEGFSVAILPEGTTKSNGEFQEMRSGVERISHYKKDGSLYLATTVPVGLTYDFLLGTLGRDIVFVNMGDAFYWEELSNNPDINKINFMEKVEGALVENHTFTASQLLSLPIYRALNQERSSISESELEEGLNNLYDSLSQIDDGRPVHLDYKLLNLSRSEMFERSMDGISRKYIKRGELDIKRLLTKPSLKKFKRKNPLLYMNNRINSIAGKRYAVKRMINDLGYRDIAA